MVAKWREHLGLVEDLRSAGGVRHHLDEILVIVILAVICGAEDCEGIADLGQTQEEWLSTFLTLRYGIACGETFRRILMALNPEALEVCLMDWLKDWKAYRRGGKGLWTARPRGAPSTAHVAMRPFK